MKDRTPSSDPLPNPRHEAFAREIASGRNATQAYRNVYGTENRRVASTGGSRLLRQKCVAARVKAIQQAGAAMAALDLQEIHAFLTRVVRTPAGDIAPSSDLCTRIKHLRDGDTDVWMPDKLACLRLSAKLQGFLDKPAAKPAPPESPQSDTPLFVLTEERRQILMARRRAAIQAYQNQPDEQCPDSEKPSAPEDHLVSQKHPTNEQRQAEQKHSSEAPPAPPQVSSVPIMPVRPEPSVPPSRNPAHLAWAAYPVSPNTASPPHPAVARTADPKLRISEARQHPRSFSRVTPDSSSVIVII